MRPSGLSSSFSPLYFIDRATTPGKTRHDVRFYSGPDNTNSTPIRAENNIRSSSKIGETQQEIRASLWGRVLVDYSHLVKNLIKPHFVDNALVTAIAISIYQKEDLRTAYGNLVDNKVNEAAMYDPMVGELHIPSLYYYQPNFSSTFSVILAPSTLKQQSLTLLRQIVHPTHYC